MSKQSKPPYQIRDEALSMLRQTIAKLKSPDYMLEIARASEEVQSQWSITLLRCALARNELEMVQLSEIRDRLKENEKNLAKGSKSLKASLENLKRIKQALNTVAAFVDIIARVLTLVI
jgi:hypothetical protein